MNNSTELDSDMIKSNVFVVSIVLILTLINCINAIPNPRLIMAAYRLDNKCRNIVEHGLGRRTNDIIQQNNIKPIPKAEMNEEYAMAFKL